MFSPFVQFTQSTIIAKIIPSDYMINIDEDHTKKEELRMMLHHHLQYVDIFTHGHFYAPNIYRYPLCLTNY